MAIVTTAGTIANDRTGLSTFNPKLRGTRPKELLPDRREHRAGGRPGDDRSGSTCAMSALYKRVRSSPNCRRDTRVLALQVRDLPRVTISARDHGAQHFFEAALLGDLLAKVGAPAGKAIRGPELADVVIVEDRDG
jgi:hypothetical protein